MSFQVSFWEALATFDTDDPAYRSESSRTVFLTGAAWEVNAIAAIAATGMIFVNFRIF